MARNDFIRDQTLSLFQYSFQDESISIQLVTENGTVGEIHQNVTEKNVKKWVEITGDHGSIRTSVGVLPGVDQVTWKSSIDSKISIEYRSS